MMVGCGGRFVLKKLVQSSATRYGTYAAAAAPLPRTAYAAVPTRGFFSGSFLHAAAAAPLPRTAYAAVPTRGFFSGSFLHAAAAAPLPRTAYAAVHTRGFFSGFLSTSMVSGLFNTSTSTKEDGNRRYTVTTKSSEGEQAAGPKLSEDEQNLRRLKFILDKKAEKETIKASLYNTRLSEFTNVAMCAVAFCVPDMLPVILCLATGKALFNASMAKWNNNKLHSHLLQEEGSYMYKLDDEGLHVFVNVNGLRKKDLKALIYDDLLLVATDEDSSPPAKRMKHFIKIPPFNYDHDKITADIVDGGDLHISFPFGHTREVARPNWFPVKLN